MLELCICRVCEETLTTSSLQFIIATLCLHVLFLSISCGSHFGVTSWQHGRTAIHRAAKSGNLGVIKLLLNAGADINARAKVSGVLDYVSSFFPAILVLITLCLSLSLLCGSLSLYLLVINDL